MPVTDLVIWLANRHVTGVLVTELGTVRKEFTLEKGAVVRASSNEPREYFGQFLMHFGLVNDEQLQEAYQTQYETNVRLGRILTMIDAIPEAEVVRMLKVKISETLLDAFRWKAGRFFFVDHRPAEGAPEVEVKLPLVDIHREGISRAGTWEQYDRIFPNPIHVLYVDESRAPTDVPPDSIDFKIIDFARQNLTIEAMTLQLHASDYQVAARLYELHEAGVIYAREPSYAMPVPRPSTGQTYADLAREALDSSDYAGALQHVELGAKEDPDDPSFPELKKEVEAVAKRKLADVTVMKSAVPTICKDVDATAKKRMTAKARYILARIDGRKTVDAIIQLSPMHDIEALDIIKKLETTGIINLV